MARHSNSSTIPLPRGWPQSVKTAMLHVISLAQFALAYSRSWAANSQVARVRLKAENDRLRQQFALLTEEIRIKDARMRRIVERGRLMRCALENPTGRATPEWILPKDRELAARLETVRPRRDSGVARNV